MSPDQIPALLENRTYDDISVGETASLQRTLTKEDIEVFAILSGDVNPAHLDEAYARESPFHRVIAHGMWGGTLISTVLGTRLPGPGTIYVSQQLSFLRPVGLGDVITVSVTVTHKGEKNRLRLACTCINQEGKAVISGEAEVIAPTTPIRRPATALPELHLHRHERFAQLMALTAELEPVACAVVFPVEAHGLRAAIEARHAGLIRPVFIGPRQRIRALADSLEIDLGAADDADDADALTWVDADNATEALHAALDLARTGRVQALMQGDVDAAQLLRALVHRQHGLRTHRRISHAYVADVPDHAQPFLVTDAAVNIQPTLEDKRDIVQNAIDLARVLGMAPRVAILSAAAAVHSKLSSSMDAAALCKMLERHQIAGGIVDGPLPFDAAIDADVARLTHPDSPVAGQANVLVVPNMETGDMLVKQLHLLADADVAGIVLGAQVPVILTNATDSPRTRLASAALALLLAHAQGHLDGADAAHPPG
ncbi:MAG: bifunctional enoyl-CoA hydratase/phosphate acetyltransferase [Proteobacteria bacterium]|uniref:bifunctional enoyl-CoA hydratase/phosphate acetyltransferase n=1 Tax=Aquabacterium sp. TaxID=1872578 RepID=UPI0035C7218C|nr:bifunctional enoyl-CoA hydratase/phosphate acetyltransferase [Pseudomonadota bacterium]